MPIPILSVPQMREWERATWATGQTEAEVIRRVGKRLARRARRLTHPDDFILILAGKGHNGDDARAAKEFLDERKVKVLEVLLPESDLPTLQLKLAEKPALIIDGLFGVGLNRPLSKAWQQIIATVNAAQLPILAVDVPSGLNAETGNHFGTAITATVTLTVGAPKAGLLAKAAAPFVGRLEVATEVGLIPCPLTAELNWIQAEDFAAFPPPRPAAGHKGSFGHVAIVAGSHGFHGAAVLATRGAQRAQPGLTTLFTPESIYLPVAAQLQSAMVKVWQKEISLPANTTAALIGPGMADPEICEPGKNFARRLWNEAAFPVVADASALDWLEPQPAVPDTRVITPHPGEAARLLQTTTEAVQVDRVRAVRELSQRFGGAWVVLKGSQTLIGRGEGPIFVNSSGNPQLAQGGSGDLLGGFIAGLLAQPALAADVARTLTYAVWQHGAAADQLQARRTNWIIEDLANELGNAR